MAVGITATAQTGFEVSSDGTTFVPSVLFTQNSGNASGTLYVRLSATATAGSHDWVTAATLTSADATSVNVATTSSGNSVTPVTPTVTVTVGTYYYSGSPQGPNSYTTTPTGDTGTPTWSYAGTGTTSYGPDPTPPTEVGSYNATVSLTGDGNFNSASSGPTAFTIATAPTPVITAPATLPGSLTTNHGTASSARSVAVSGTFLTANITATAQSGFEVSNNGTSFGGSAAFTQTGGIASGTLYVRLTASATAGSHDAQTAAILSSTGATPVSVVTTASGNTVGKGSQTITFALGTAVPKGLGAAPFADTATASSGLTVTYSSDNTGVATVDTGGTVTVVALGTCHILANQAGDDNWNAAPQVSQTLTVSMISNGGFEVNTGSNYGDATDWVKEGAVGIESGYNSTWAYNSGGSATSGFYQTLGAPLVAGLKYQLTYNLLTWATGNQMHVRVGKYLGGNHYSDASYGPLPLAALDTSAAGAVWAPYSHTFIAVGGEDTVYFGASAIQQSDPGGKYDNVALAIMPFNLSYNANGGTGTAPGPYAQNYGTTIAAAPADTFSRANYTFASWNTAADGSGTTYAPGATFTFTADTVLYAQWTSNANYDSWALAQSPPLTGGADAVGADGLSNLMIYAIAGLNTSHTNGAAGTLDPLTRQLTFTKRSDAITGADVSWTIQTSPDLVTWTTQVSQPKGDTTPTISYTLPAGAGTLFARLVVSE